MSKFLVQILGFQIDFSFYYDIHRKVFIFKELTCQFTIQLSFWLEAFVNYFLTICLQLTIVWLCNDYGLRRLVPWEYFNMAMTARRLTSEIVYIWWLLENFLYKLITIEIKLIFTSLIIYYCFDFLKKFETKFEVFVHIW